MVEINCDEEEKNDIYKFEKVKMKKLIYILNSETLNL